MQMMTKMKKMIINTLTLDNNKLDSLETVVQISIIILICKLLHRAQVLKEITTTLLRNEVPNFDIVDTHHVLDSKKVNIPRII